MWAPRAKQDLGDIHRYYRRTASPQIADDVLRAIDRVIRRIAERPRASRPREELLPGLRSVLAKPYTIFLRLGRDGVEIVRILHERRDVPAALAKDNDDG